MEAFLSPHPPPSLRPLVYCNAAEVQVSFFIHRPVYILRGGGQGWQVMALPLERLVFFFFFPLVLNRLQYCLDSSPEICPWEVCPLLLLLGYGLRLEQF